jgi:hypothetical protein
MSLIALVTTIHPIAYYYKPFLRSTQFLLWLQPVEVTAFSGTQYPLFTQAHYEFMDPHCTTVKVKSKAIPVTGRGGL